ncbi:TetR/AcrR family transcriptional regulator [Arthrobacter sp.]|uniref:TetR/AcrR family transcriptional regulator n=1 Tax=Arthrobacter sp. TaxID=1667 RepID=UPI0026E0D2F4|nr:TetR/AcrR family transcriptional regulator [Arthrobacter sp.]MDO5751987.1 TetR/AcrR family transcriptional regulator [Arthrobacter sp.]
MNTQGAKDAVPEPAKPTQGEILPSVAGAGRRYSGMCSADRVLERHGRLVAAGIDVFGTQGYGGTKIKTLCKSAGLSERYFYESFESREDLLATIYDHLAAVLLKALKAAFSDKARGLLAAVKAGTGEVVHFMLDDPRHVRILLVEMVGVSDQLEAMRHRSLNDFADETMNQLLLLCGTDPKEAREWLAAHPEDQAMADILDFARLTAVSIVGGVNNMLLDALQGGTLHKSQRIIDVSCQLISNASLGIRALAEKQCPHPAIAVH